jgi:hypothetical protein
MLNVFVFEGLDVAIKVRILEKPSYVSRGGTAGSQIKMARQKDFD